MRHLILRENEAPTVDGRTIVARIATYDRVYTPAPDERERVKQGSFRAPLARPSGLVRYRHVGERPGDVDDPMHVYGFIHALREQGTSVIAECRLAENDRADHLLSLIRGGAMRGVSVSMTIAESQTAPDGIVDIQRISAVHGLSLTPDPGYADAEVLALREHDAKRAATVAAELQFWDSLRTVRH
jgi:hypothetical protein